MVAPANNSINTTRQIGFAYLPVASVNFSNASLYSNHSGWVAVAFNASPVVNASSNYFNVTLASSGSFVWGVRGCLQSGYCNFSRNFTHEVEVLSASISSPSGDYSFGTPVDLVFTASGDFSEYSANYTLDNQTFDAGTAVNNTPKPVSLGILAVGEHVVEVSIANGLFSYVSSPVFFDVSEAEVNDSIIYDANGNRIHANGLYFEYNGFNQLVRVRRSNAFGEVLEEYSYDHEGNRLTKFEPLLNQTTYYVSDDYVEIVNASGTFPSTYYYENDVLIGRKDWDGKKYFYHPDHLGSTSIVTNETGQVVEETAYEPFGNVFEGGSDRYTYTGKEKDTGTGLFYYGARYYDPIYSQFTQPDQTIPDLYKPLALNRYAYVYNNPYKHTDPDGRVALLAPALFGGTIGFLVGAVGTAYSQYTTAGSLNFNEIGRNGAIGAVGGATAAVAGTVAAVYAAGSLGTGLLGSAAVAGGVGNVVGSEAAVATSNVISGEPVEKDVGNPERMAGNALVGAGIGVGTAYLTGGFSQIRPGDKLATPKGFLTVTRHASQEAPKDSITRWQVINTVENNAGKPYTYKGQSGYTGYYDSKTKVFVPVTPQNTIPTLFKSRPTYYCSLTNKN